jgi:hypothetical protein
MDEEVVQDVVDVDCRGLFLGEGDGRCVTVDGGDLSSNTAQLASESPLTATNIQHLMAISRECSDDQRVVMDVVIP